MLNLLQKKSENIRVDLHMHTAASDGTWQPEKLVEKVLEAGLDIFAVTDHDTTENIKETTVLAQKHGLSFVPGVEINTTCDCHNYHILGLGINPRDKALQSLLEKNRKVFEEADDESIKYLAKSCPDISYNDYKDYINNPERGGWKALNYLIDRDLCSNHREFFMLFQGASLFDKMILGTVEEAVQVIVYAGGKPVLAHPGVSFYDPDYKSVISRMLISGIEGLECFHPENSDEITRYCLNICKSKDLLITGGSDCHGDFLPNRRLGSPDIKLSQLNLGSLLTRITSIR